MYNHGVSLRARQMLRGPNLYAIRPVMHVLLEAGQHEHASSDNVKRLSAWVPVLVVPGEQSLAALVVELTLALQRSVGFDVAWGRALATDEAGVYRLLVAYVEEEVVKACLDTALRMALAALHDEAFDIAGELAELHSLADQYRLGPSTAAIVDAARRRDIPVFRLTPQANLVQFGHGVYQKRIQAGATSNTGALAVNIAQDKLLTNELLRSLLIPVPEGYKATSADGAWEAAQEIDASVVVKPVAGNQGKGVSVNLSTEAEVRAAYDLAAAYDRRVLVERFVAGNDYRLLVVGEQLVAAAQRHPAQVVGDGVHTVEELVDIANQNPQRRPGHGGALTLITLNTASDLVLAQQQLARTDVPAPRQTVYLRANANLSTGGTATDVTDLVHPANARTAVLAAQVLGLDIAGIDVICRDIGVPLAEQDGALVELNAAPGLRMHLNPTNGQGRDVGAPIVTMLYPEPSRSRIPVVAITGTNGKTTTTRLIAHIFATANRVVGMTTTEGVYIDGERVDSGDCSGPQSARAVLLHPRVEAAVLETARGGILREGLAFDGCAVGVVTNISADHLGLGGVETLDDLARVKEVVVRAVRPDGAAVLNADDPLVAEMAAASPAPVIFFSTHASHPTVLKHLAANGRAVIVEDNLVVLADGDTRLPLIDLAQVPYANGGRVRFLVQNTLAGTAAAWGAGLDHELIARALTTFAATPELVPGRFNVLDVRGVQIVLDYGHNAGALAAVAQGVAALGPRRTVMVMCLPGDRRDEDLRATVRETLSFGDEYVLYDLRNLRNRAEGEVPRLLRSAIPPERPCTIVADQAAALPAAWKLVRPGDRIVFMAAESERGLQQIAELAADAATE